MARPSHTNQVQDRLKDVGTVELARLTVHNPAITKAFAEFLTAFGQAGGKTESQYGSIQLKLPKTEAELESELESEQYRWDEMHRKYEACMVAGTEPETSWDKRAMTKWATAELLPLPWEAEALTR